MLDEQLIPLDEDNYEYEDNEIRFLRERKRKQQEYIQEEETRKLQNKTTKIQKPMKTKQSISKQVGPISIDFKVKSQVTAPQDHLIPKTTMLNPPSPIKSQVEVNPMENSPRLNQREIIEKMVLQKGVRITDQNGNVFGDLHKKNVHEISKDFSKQSFNQKMTRGDYNEMMTYKKAFTVGNIKPIEKKGQEEELQKKIPDRQNSNHSMKRQVNKKQDLHIKQNILNLNNYNEDLNKKIMSTHNEIPQSFKKNKNGQLNVMDHDILRQMLMD